MRGVKRRAAGATELLGDRHQRGGRRVAASSIAFSSLCLATGDSSDPGGLSAWAVAGRGRRAGPDSVTGDERQVGLTSSSFFYLFIFFIYYYFYVFGVLS